MAKVVVDFSMSLDGFIAGPDDDLVGKGIWLFDNLDDSIELEVVRTVAAPGVTHITYRVVK